MDRIGSWEVSCLAVSGIRDILPVGEIMRQLMVETEAALSIAPNFGEAASQRREAERARR